MTKKRKQFEGNEYDRAVLALEKLDLAGLSFEDRVRKIRPIVLSLRGYKRREWFAAIRNYAKIPNVRVFSARALRRALERARRFGMREWPDGIARKEGLLS